MSAGDYPVVMCDDDSGCMEWALDHTLHGLGTLVGSATQLPDGWTGDAPGVGRDEQFCPKHARVTPPTKRGVLGPHPACESCGEVYNTDEGCAHDGHSRCASCLDTCSECRDAINDYVRD